MGGFAALHRVAAVLFVLSRMNGPAGFVLLRMNGLRA